MSSWAAKRRLTYLLIVGGFFLLVIGIPVFKVLHKPASCFDAKQNQGEGGIDCGGSCQRLCLAEVLPVIVHWQRSFEVTPTVYSALAYIENPNVSAGAKNVSYVFKFYTKENQLIYERVGTVNVPPKKIFAIFEHSVTIPKKPARVDFEFTSDPEWDKNYPEEQNIPISDRELRSPETKPSLYATIVNPYVYPLLNIQVTALIKDTEGNVIATSQTYIDKIEKGGTQQAVFTWPQPFPSQSRVCEVSTDIMLSIDRSGSMDDDGIDPPQPLTDVKNAASAFLDTLKSDDQAGVVSFATAASVPVDSELSSNISAVKSAVNAISILKVGSQTTNIGDGLKKASDELATDRHKSRSKPIIVLLTDGEANLPLDATDEEYPTTYALSIATKAKQKNIDIYTIGLGNKVNEGFLKKIATSPEYFFSALTTKDLEGVYTKISSSICKIGPSIIDIITRTNAK